MNREQGTLAKKEGTHLAFAAVGDVQTLHSSAHGIFLALHLVAKAGQPVDEGEAHLGSFFREGEYALGSSDQLHNGYNVLCANKQKQNPNSTLFLCPLRTRCVNSNEKTTQSIRAPWDTSYAGSSVLDPVPPGSFPACHSSHRREDLLRLAACKKLLTYSMAFIVSVSSKHHNLYCLPILHSTILRRGLHHTAFEPRNGRQKFLSPSRKTQTH